jgi:hypothetical protein
MYHLRRDQNVLEAAIGLLRESLDMCSLESPSRFANLGSLSKMLLAQHKLTMEAAPLEEAVSLARECVGCCPPEHEYHKFALSTLLDALEVIAAKGEEPEALEELQHLRDELETLESFN